MKALKASIPALALLVTTGAAAATETALDFVVNSAHKHQFTKCDKAIRNVFESVQGAVRINTSFHNNTKSDSLRISSTYGRKGDSVFIDATFRQVGNKCETQETAVIDTEISCIAYRERMKTYEVTAESADYLWMSNKGGALLLLKPTQGNGCQATFMNGRVF